MRGARPMECPFRTVGRLPAVLMILVLAAAAFSGVHAGDHLDPAVLNLRLADQGGRTRLVLNTTAAIEIRFEHRDQPDRLVLDLGDAAWRAADIVSGAGMIRSITQRTGDHGRTELVLNLERPARVRDIFYLPPTNSLPYRLVIDLEFAGFGTAPERSPMAEPNAAPGLPDVAPVILPLPRTDIMLPLVAIDAGHGGTDPGTIGRSGILEKHLTIAVARRLRAALDATGRYRTVMTREGDETIRLRNRIRIARSAGADLLISLHADSNPIRSLRGVSVYTLSENASDAEAEQLAARENRVDALGGIELDAEDDATAGILIDLTQRQTMSEANTFAEMLLRSLGSEAILLNNSHRFAGFTVLKAPEIPSILLELGHLSNRHDEQLLLDPSYQDRMVHAIVRAMDAYFAWQRHVRRL